MCYPLKLLKRLRYIILMFSIIIAIRSENLFVLWFSFELNLVSFCYIIWRRKNFSSSNRIIKYFVIQTFSRINFLLLILISELLGLFRVTINLIYLIIVFKLGFFPFFFWVLEVVEGIRWESLILFFSVQKIIPLYVIRIIDAYHLIFLLFLGCLVGLWGLLNQSSLRKFLVFSRLIHISWIIVSFRFRVVVWLFYVFFYMGFIVILYYFKNLNSFFQLKYLSLRKLLLFFVVFLNFRGLPPFLGFFPKILILNYFYQENFRVFIFLIILAILTSYIYIRYLRNIFFFLKNNIYKSYKNNLFLYYIIIMFLIFIVILILLL